jgi:hypothetical protein
MLLATSAWAGDVAAPPAAPTATTPSPFVVRLGWPARDDDLRTLVEERRGERPWMRIAIAPPHASKMELHAREPATMYAYRLRAIADVVSTPSPEVHVSTPPLPTAEPPGDAASDCTSFGDISRTGEVSRVLLRGERLLDLRPESAAGGEPSGETSAWGLYGETDGCYRALGTLIMASPTHLTDAMHATSGGWPLLVVLRREGGWSTIQVHQLVGGRFTLVDSYTPCEWYGQVEPDAPPPPATVTVPCQYP